MIKQQLLGILMLFVCLADGVTRTTVYTPATNTLQLLHVVFRHGDRTQDGTYPNDPYQHETYYPVGVGQLTNAGKNTAYNIGTYLRKTYKNFIPNVYSPGVIEANSSPVPRCKTSMQLVLAGLFPPADIQRWSKSLNWQPIPYDYLPQSENLYFFSYAICQKFFQFYGEYQNTTTYRNIYEPYENVLNYLAEHSGINFSYFPPSMILYSTLRSQEEWGLTLPEWADSVWPEPITTLTKYDWQNLFATQETRAIGAGFLLSKIINDTKLTINGNSSVDGLKAYLYAGHDLNIAAILSWLGTPDLHIPQYGSFIVFEIHNFSGTPFIRVVHQNYESKEPQVVEIPDCGYYCQFDKFVDLYSQYTNRIDLCH